MYAIHGNQIVKEEKVARLADHSYRSMKYAAHAPLNEIGERRKEGGGEEVAVGDEHPHVHAVGHGQLVKDVDAGEDHLHHHHGRHHIAAAAATHCCLAKLALFD